MTPPSSGLGPLPRPCRGNFIALRVRVQLQNLQLRAARRGMQTSAMKGYGQFCAIAQAA